MKKTILILIAIFSITILNAQRYINIGSSKNDVKEVMGEPISIKNYQYLEEEVWSYGKQGLSTVTFKNGKLFEYNNSCGILKIEKKLDPIKRWKNSESIINTLSEKSLQRIYDRQVTDDNIVYHPQLGELTRLTKNPTISEDIDDYTGTLDSVQPQSFYGKILFGILCLILFFIIRFMLIRKKIKFTDESKTNVSNTSQF